MLDRRHLLTLGAAALATAAGPARFAHAQARGALIEPTPAQRGAMTAAAEAFRAQHAVPGLGIAIARQGQVVFDAAFGFAESEPQTPLSPEHRFRLASISKAITSVAVFRLAEAGRLRLSDRVLAPGGLLAGRYGAAAAAAPALADITIDHLLTHTAGGWSNDRQDPMFSTPGLDHDTLIARTLATRPLADPPGTRYAYSNFGYCLLGRAVEAAAGMPYDACVQQAVFAPAGAADLALAGNTLRDRQPPEVRYYGSGSEDPYALNVRRMDSHGGWIGSAGALVRFAAALDALLSPASMAAMLAPAAQNPRYARGWNVNERGTHWHTGSLAGTATILVRGPAGLCWAGLCNTRNRAGTQARDLDRLLWTMVRAVPAWGAA